MIEPKVPINYFGRGENYALPDNFAVIKDFEEKFREWEREHPDDPTGEITLQAWRDSHAKPAILEVPKIIPLPEKQESIATILPPVVTETPVIENEIPDELDYDTLKLTLPIPLLDKLKKYSKLKKKRPRDIVSFWILHHCKIEL